MPFRNNTTKEVFSITTGTVGILTSLSMATAALTGSVDTGIHVFVAGVAIAFSLYLFRNRLGWENGTG